MSRIPEDIMTLGLIIKTRPFQYNDNTVTCDFEDYIEIEQLEQLKQTIVQQRDTIPDEEKTDDLVRSYNDDIYFIDCIIENLKSA